MTPLSHEQPNIFEETRNHLLDRLYVVLALAFLPAILMASIRTQDEGWTAAHSVHIVGYCLFLGVVWFRRRIPYLWRAGIPLAIWWISASITLVVFGPISNAKSILVIVVMLTAFLLPLRVGIGMVVLLMLTIGAVGVAVISADWHFAVNYSQRLRNPITWVLSAYYLGLFSGIAAYTVWLMVNTLRKTLLQSQDHAKRLNRALQQQKAIFSSSNAAMCILKDRVFVEVNDYLARLFGYEPDELVGRSTRMLHIDDNHYEAFAKVVEFPLHEEGHSALEYPFRHRDGSCVWLYLSITALEGETVLVGIDITELRQAREAAESANRAKSAFLANMSHELRTPLNAVLGFADALTLAPNLDARQHDYLAAIRQGGDHLLELINDLLDLAKIEDGQIELAPVHWSPELFFPEVIRLFSVRAAEKELDLRFVAVTPLPAMLCSDERRLRQVLMNLLGNAIKFTEQGWVRVSVSHAGGQLHIEVADSGMGIEPEEIEGIFERFRQATAVRHMSQGTGLGLSISHRLVELMGGKLSASSVPGEGSVFRFELPVQSVGPGSTAREALAETTALTDIPRFRARQNANGAAPRVLVVDDVAHNRMLVAALLEPLGFAVSEAVDGRACLEQVAEEAPEAVIVDMQMPGMDGLETVQRLRMMGYGGVVVMISASAFEADCNASLEAGCDAFVPKPINFHALGSVFKRIALAESSDQTVAVREAHPAHGPTDVVKEETLLDRAVLALNYQLIPPPRLASIIDEFERQGEEQIARLVDALHKRVNSEAQSAAHRLAGGAGMLGLYRLQRLCNEIESGVATMPVLKFGALSDELVAVYAASVTALKAIRGRVDEEVNGTLGRSD